MNNKLLPTKWLPAPATLIELFAFANLAFLALDIYLAHSINSFRHPAEWIPFAFSVLAALGMIVSWILGGIPPRSNAKAARFISALVGIIAIAIGVTGMLLHLESRFFEEMTVRNLVYAAPFVAPLAYTGIGLLVLLNRMVDHKSMEWAQWILFLALGGFIGNFVLCLADHAQNGFFDWREWIGVISSAIAVGFLLSAATFTIGRSFAMLTGVILLVQMAVGALGFALHLSRNLAGPSESLWQNFLYGAPAFAPLLFANLSLLGLIGLWAMSNSSAISSATKQSAASLF